MVHGIDLFVVISGSIGILSTVPLGYLAYRGHADARELRRIQEELAEIQREIRQEQRVAVQRIEETRERVESVGRAASYIGRSP